MEKKEKIITKQKQQDQLKTEIQKMKNKIPKLILGFVLFVFVCFYLFGENNPLTNNIKIIIYSLTFLSALIFLMILRTFININKKEKYSKEIGVQIYNLMKLDLDK